MFRFINCLRYLERVHNNISWDKAKDCKTSIQLSIEKYFFQGCSYIVCSNEFLFSKTFPLCCGKFSIDHKTIFNYRADQQPLRSKPVNLWRVVNHPDLSRVIISTALTQVSCIIITRPGPHLTWEIHFTFSRLWDWTSTSAEAR